MLHKFVFHEEHGHDEDEGGFVFRGKGNRSLPWSDEEERELGGSGSGGWEEMGRPGWSKDRRPSGSGSGSGTGGSGKADEQPGMRKVGRGCVEGVCEGFD